VSRVNIFHISFVGGLLFVLVACFLIHNNLEVKWYLIGMGQIMLAAGLVGMVINWKGESN